MSERAISISASKLIESLQRNCPRSSEETLHFLSIIEDLLSQQGSFSIQSKSSTEKFLCNVESELDSAYAASQGAPLPDKGLIKRCLRFILSPPEEQASQCGQYIKYPDWVYMPATLLKSSLVKEKEFGYFLRK